jgi:hypothetical protein
MEVDLSKLDPGVALKVDEVLRGRFNELIFAAAQRQRDIAARNYLNRPVSRDGFGGKTVEVDAAFDAMWRCYYGHNYSENKDLMKFLSKRNPEIVCRPTGTKIMVGWAPGSESKRPVGVEIRGQRTEDGRQRTEGQA